jgi:translation initiation factor 1
MSDDRKPFHNPFAAALGHLPREGAAEPPPRAESARPTRALTRAVVRIERSGRGGKVVTVIEQLGLEPVEQERWLVAIKAALGCGGTIEGDTLVFQGDQRGRLPAVLTARGVKKVTVA